MWLCVCLCVCLCVGCSCAASLGRSWLKSTAQAALPQSLHGGPGRAGGGEELGGLAGLRIYQQRVALQGTRTLVDALLA